MAFIEEDKIFEATNDGLDIILSYYPQAERCVSNKTAKFKIREEKTASATLHRSAKTENRWVVTDWGGDQTSRNAIHVVMYEENIGYKEALDLIASKWNVAGTRVVPDSLKPTLEQRPATEEEHDGDYIFEVRKDDSGKIIFTEFELDTLGPAVRASDAIYLHFRPLVSFTYIKNRKAYITYSTDTYPIFIIQEQGFTKIYQPLNPDKKYRFRYSGSRPNDFVFGLAQLEQAYEDGKADYIKELEESDADVRLAETFKLDRVILCAGDRDALNVKSIDERNHVVWLNSESAKLTGRLYHELASICREVYNLPDIDSTGRRQGTALALKYLDMKTIWLPESLAKIRDWRGNFCKDVTDWVKHVTNYYRDRPDKDRRYKLKSKFMELMNIALPARFWDETYSESKGKSFTFNNAQAYYFLNLNGFWRYEQPNDYIFIKITGNQVEEVDPVKIKNFVNKFVEDRKLPVGLRNMIYKTTQLSEGSLSNLKTIDIDFTDFDKHSQYLFFRNCTWRISAEEIKVYKPGEVDKFVWADEVIDHKVTSLDPFYQVKTSVVNDSTVYDIEILNNQCMFFRYLINTSRIHWVKQYGEIGHEGYADQLEDKDREKYLQDIAWNIGGPGLDHEEVQEQKHHLINKLYSLGYLLHRYKDDSRPWCVFAIDNKISNEGESHGGAGKSIAYKAIKHFMKYVEFNGRNSKLTDNPHIYENVTEHTDYILIDDANRYLKFDFFFKPLTGDLDVNPKGQRQYSIPFENSPKFCITSNYTLMNVDPSTERRLLYTVFSDYYHFSSNGEYRRSWSPADEFKKNLFRDFTEDEWNHFFNLMAQSLQLYLRHGKIEPPMDNVMKRQLKREMTDAFKGWADVYLDGSLNTEVSKKASFDSFKEETNLHNWKTQKFTTALKAWCKYYGYEYNPADACNTKDGRIIKKGSDEKAVEYFLIRGQRMDDDETPVQENLENF